MSDQFQGWIRNDDGSITTNPMLGWAMAAFPGSVLVRLDVKQSGEGFDTEPFQFHIPAEKVRDFAEALIQTADQAATGSAPPAFDPYPGF
jgi:hypothetical protein